MSDDTAEHTDDEPDIPSLALVKAIAEVGIGDELELLILKNIPDRKASRMLIARFRELRKEVDSLRRAVAKHERRAAVIALSRVGHGTNQIAAMMRLPAQQVSKVIRSWREEHADITSGKAQLHSVDIHKRPNSRKRDHYDVEMAMMRNGVEPDKIFETLVGEHKALSAPTRSEPLPKPDPDKPSILDDDFLDDDFLDAFADEKKPGTF